MRKLIIFLLALISVNTYGQLLSALPTTTTGTSGDFLIKNDASPSYTKKITVGNFISTYGLLTTGTTLPIANGGTGQTTATAAFDALAPTQTGNSGKYLTTNGTTASWATVSSGGVSGSGTTNTIPLFTGTTAIGNSFLSQSATGGSGVKIASGKLFQNSTGVNFINMFDGTYNNGISLYGNGNGITVADAFYSTVDTYIGQQLSYSGALNFYNSTNSNKVSFISQPVAADIQYQLPLTAPTSGQVLQSTAPSAGVATLSWATPSSGSGTVTSVATGFGLTGGTITTTGTLKIDTTTGNLNGARPATQYYVNANYSPKAGSTSLTTLGTVTTGTWNATAIGTQYGGTGANNATNTSGSFLRSNGANGNYVASTLILPNSLTANYVLYGSSTNNVGSSSNLQFDGTNLGVGMTPSNPIDVTKTQNATSSISIVNANGSSSAYAQYLAGNGTNNCAFGIGGTGAGSFANKAYFGTGTSGGIQIYASNASGFIDFQTNGSIMARMSSSGRMYIGGSTNATALLHLAAGSTTASTSPLKFTIGSANTTGEAGAMEYSTINSVSQLTFVRSGTTRETILMGNTGASAPSTNTIGTIADYYGTSATRVLTTPTTWISVVGSDGTTYKIPAY